MAKFVLIDHSITDVGGHYYEYAVRVLRAAEEAGYEPVLATNRRLRQGAQFPWRVVPCYRYDFFEPGPAGALTTIRRSLGGTRRALARLKYRLMFSRLGLLWLKRRQGATAGAITSRRFLAAAIVAELLLYALRTCNALLRLTLAVVPIGNYAGNVLSNARHVGRTAARPWRALFGQGSMVWQQVHAWRKRAAFAADTGALFREVRLEQGDVVFIPTLAEADLLGLLAMFQTNARTAKASWHLVFRRNAYQGRDPDYAAQEEDLRSLRNAFRRFQSQLCGQRVVFYTDTAQLTAQYNRLGVALFRTAPIPVAADFQQALGNGRCQSGKTWESPRLVSDAHRLASPYDGRLATQASDAGPEGKPVVHVVYIGDARTEKGYHWLPHLVSDAFAGQLPVRFTFQSNFNVPHGEPAAVVARAQLEAMSDAQKRAGSFGAKHHADRSGKTGSPLFVPQVDLIKQPLASDEYRKLLLDADVVVIPYDRDNYYARSSGVFAEALVAGKPVIVPAGTWMASQLSSAIYQYHTALRERCAVIATFDGRDLPWETHLGKCGNIDSEDGLPVLGKSPTHSLIDVPQGATHLLLTFQLTGQSSGVFPGIVSEHFAADNAVASRTVALAGGAPEGECSALVCVNPSTPRIRLGISNALSTLPIAIHRVRIDFLTAVDNVPASAVGTVYAEPNELYQHLGEIINHYEHYRSTAGNFSHAWSLYHCAGALVEQLVGKTSVSDADASVVEMKESTSHETRAREAA